MSANVPSRSSRGRLYGARLLFRDLAVVVPRSMLGPLDQLYTAPFRERRACGRGVHPCAQRDRPEQWVKVLVGRLNLEKSRLGPLNLDETRQAIRPPWSTRELSTAFPKQRLV